jgi:hypothetical protein
MIFTNSSVDEGERHQIESPKRPTKNSTQGRLPLTRLSKIHPLILIL